MNRKEKTTLVLIAVVAFLLAVALSGCGQDEDIDQSPPWSPIIDGTWSLTGLLTIDTCFGYPTLTPADFGEGEISSTDAMNYRLYLFDYDQETLGEEIVARNVFTAEDILQVQFVEPIPDEDWEITETWGFHPKVDEPDVMLGSYRVDVYGRSDPSAYCQIEIALFPKKKE